MSRILLFLLAAYRSAKGLLPATARCRHWPSCSQYAEEAVRRHGAAAGARLALARLARCHPWGTSGVDPVPERS
jgi:putative membrane protein insertion efficiency factor